MTRPRLDLRCWPTLLFACLGTPASGVLAQTPPSAEVAPPTSDEPPVVRDDGAPVPVEPMAVEPDRPASPKEPVTDEPLPPTPRKRGPATHAVTLSDGQHLTGRVVESTPEHVALLLEDGALIVLPTSAVRGVEAFEARAVVGAWGPDSNVSRYLYSPAAFSLGQGHGYLAQRAIAISSAGVGLFDFLDIEAGTVLPMLFSKDRIGVAGLKLAAPVADVLHVGAGAQAFLLPDDIAAGFVFGNVTFGTADAHATLAGGGAFEFTAGDFAADVVTLSGNLRLGSGVALISENWFIYFHDRDGPWGGPFFAAPAAGVRLFGSEFAVDLALVGIVTGDHDVPFLPLPWLSFAWNWSLAPRDPA